MSTVAAGICSCGSIGREDLRRCDEHHRYWRGDKELASVSKVVKSTWPGKMDFSKAPMDRIEHARERGVRVDRRFAEYLKTGRIRLKPDEEWQEVIDLLKALVAWWNTTSLALTKPSTQVILADDEIAGTCDFLCEGIIPDLKCTHDIETIYHIQLGAYADLYESTFGKPASAIGLIHVHKRFKEPKWIPLDMEQCVADWRLLREMWRMVQRRTA